MFLSSFPNTSFPFIYFILFLSITWYYMIRCHPKVLIAFSNSQIELAVDSDNIVFTGGSVMVYLEM